MEREVGRKHPARHPVFERENLSVIVFLTVCTHHRRKILASPDVMRILVRSWISADHWIVGRFIILPDHIHLFCSPANPNSLGLRAWMRHWKSSASKMWPDPSAHPIWQIDGWDTQLRQSESYSTKWDYVRENPIRHGLVSRAQEWPFQGELNPLVWHDK